MKAYAKQLKYEHYYCESCESFYEGSPDENSGYDIPYGGRYTDDDLADNAVTWWTCENGCDTDDEDEMVIGVSEVWICGECQTWFTDKDSAVDCCR